MRSATLFLGLAPLASIAIAVACSAGGTGDPSSLVGGVPCKRPVASSCCGLWPDCVDDWTSARECATWPSCFAPTIFDTPCDGYLAISFTSPPSVRLYDATNRNLVALLEQGAGSSFSCTLGPPALGVTSACFTTWASAGAPCATDAPTTNPTVVCPGRTDLGASDSGCVPYTPGPTDPDVRSE